MTAHLLTEAARRWLKQQLVDARKAGLSVAQATARITEAIEDFGMDNGFVPVEPLRIEPKLQGACIVIGFYEATYAEASIEVQ